MAQTTAKPRHLAEIDLVRVIVVGLVIATHVAATGVFYNSTTSGAVWMLSHVSRNVFFLLSALVLCYVYGAKAGMNAHTFYRRRFVLVVPPYVAWTLIYMVRNNDLATGWPHFGLLFLTNLATAGAMYHLYFLLVIMQLYLLFPLIHRALPFVRRHGRTALAASFALQLIQTTVLFLHLGAGPLTNWWLDHADYHIWSYQFYVLLGAVIGLSFERFELWLRRWWRWVTLGALAVAAGGEIIYFYDVARGVRPDAAATEFQPYLVVEGLIFTLMLLGAAFRWTQQGAPFKKLVTALSQNSFGIYLAHVFVISYLMGWQPQSSSWPVVVPSLIIGVPLVYALSFGLAELLRQTPLSIALTGRPPSRSRYGIAKRSLHQVSHAGTLSGSQK